MTDHDTPQLYSHTVALPSVDYIDVVSQAKSTSCLFWRSANGITYAGIGTAAELKTSGETRFQEISKQARALFAGLSVSEESPLAAAPKIFGGFSFQTGAHDDAMWQAFPEAFFSLPEILITSNSDGTWLTFTASSPEQARENAAKAARQSSTASEAAARQHTSTGRQEISYLTSADDWRIMIDTATRHIKAGELDKIVLSRTCEVTEQAPIRCAEVLRNLLQRYINCYHFAFVPEVGRGFVGATPELLARTNGNSLTTMALAGSIARGETNVDDFILENNLLSSTKDRAEHTLVVDFFTQMLESTVKKLDIAPFPIIHKLANIQHLRTDISAELGEGQDILSIIEHLHPTPALGGTPRERALELIEELEPVNRGWYGGPIGWLDMNNNGEFAVALRCAVFHGKTARLYAGGGIVADSKPENEYIETTLKFRPILEALRQQ